MTLVGHGSNERERNVAGPTSSQEPQEVLNNDVEVVARLLVHNVGDGVQVMILYPTGGYKTLLYLTGASVAKASNIAIKRRPGGRVAESTGGLGFPRARA